MTILQMFEKVNLTAPTERRNFYNYLNDSVNEIAGLYGDMPKMTFSNNITAADIVPIVDFSDRLTVLPLYHDAIVDNILFLCGYGEEHKGEFIRKSREAYLHYWNLYSKNRRMKRGGW